MFKCKKYLLVLLIIPVFTAFAQHSEEEEHHHGLHFAHPLFTESISPDTKLRFDYQYTNADEFMKTSELHLEYEYAFDRAFSVSITAPYLFISQTGSNLQSGLGEAELSFKFANYVFEHNNVLLGYGISFGLPTGNENKGTGSDHIIGIEPFLNMGYMLNDFEFTFFSTFGIPSNLQNNETVENNLNLQLAVVYNLTESLQGILELNRESIINGNINPEPGWYFAPGIKAIPFKKLEKIIFGLGVRLPLSNQKEFNTQIMFTTFYHF